MYVCVCVYVCVFNPRSSHTKDSKMVHYAFALNSRHFKVQIKSKWSNPEKGVAPSSKPRCSSYCKGDPRVVLVYSRLIYVTYVYIYIYIYIYIWK